MLDVSWILISHLLIVPALELERASAAASDVKVLMHPLGVILLVLLG